MAINRENAKASKERRMVFSTFQLLRLASRKMPEMAVLRHLGKIEARLCFACHGPAETIGAIPTSVSLFLPRKFQMRSDRLSSSLRRTAPLEAPSRGETLAVRRLNRRELPVDTE